MNRVKSILSNTDKFFNGFVQKGSNNTFFEYLVKYLLACGIGFNIFLIIFTFSYIYG